MTLPPPENLRDRAIVLVHGAWVGEWSWAPVLPGLTASGRPVHAVSLTGHGARRHQSGPHVNLGTHVDDVVSHIENHDLTNVTLVGHSYGGRVITKVWERLAHRIQRLVFLDAHTPVGVEAPQTPDRIAAAEEAGGMLDFQSRYDPDPAIVGGPGGVDWFHQRVMPQSFACLTDDWMLPLPDELPKSFIYASADEPSRFADYAAICRDNPAWDYHELPGTHFLMMTHPAEVIRIILDE